MATQGSGEILGRAILFDRRTAPVATATRSSAPAARASRQASGGDDPIDLSKYVTTPDGVQFDDAGITEQVYQAYGGLRNFLVQARARGFDPTMGPDPSVPGSSEYVALWHRAVAAYEQILERSQQGKENMEALKKAHLEGTAQMTDAVRSGSTGILSDEELIGESASTTPDWIQDANQYLATEPSTAEEETLLKQFYDAQVAVLQEDVKAGRMNEEFLPLYLSMLRLPQKYNPLEDEATKALTAQRRASAEAARQQARKTARELQEPVYPELSEMVINLEKAMGAASPDALRALNDGNEITSKTFAGTRLAGDPKGPVFESAEAVELSNGRRGIKMRFVPEPGETKTEAEYRQAFALGNSPEEAARLAREAFLSQQRGEPVEIFVTEDNPLAGYFAILNRAERQKVASQIGAEEGKTESGQLDLPGIKRILGMEGAEGDSFLPASSRTQGSQSTSSSGSKRSLTEITGQ